MSGGVVGDRAGVVESLNWIHGSMAICHNRSF
jgi:hypothetical protein